MRKATKTVTTASGRSFQVTYWKEGEEAEPVEGEGEAEDEAEEEEEPEPSPADKKKDAVARSLMLLAGRRRPGTAILQRKPGAQRRADKYRERLLAHSVQRASAALAPYLQRIRKEVQGAGSIAELRARVLRAYKDEDIGELAEVIKRMNVLAALAGELEARNEAQT